MPQQIGRTLIIQIGNGASTEVFTNLCGLKTRSFSLSAGEIDTSIPSCTNPGDEVIKTSRPGMVNRTFSGSGAFVSSTVMSAFMEKVINAEQFNAKVIVPGVGTFTGPFFVTDFEFSGDMENNMEFSATFVPADAVTFVAEV